MKHSFCFCYPVFLFIGLFIFLEGATAQQYKQLTDLPSVYINTYNGHSITSKDVYTEAYLVYVDGDTFIQYDSLQIRGRGNSTWGMAKKPYRIKFRQKEKFLGQGYAKARSWTLIANCADKTLIRNALTSETGKYLGLQFNPAARFVDFFLNKTYLGTYQISDQIDIRPHRVNIFEQDYVVKNLLTDITGGYLLEATANTDSSDPYFRTTRGVTVRIHNPSDSIIERQKNYISRYVQNFENALYSTVDPDAPKGYKHFVDTLSLVNWYITNEIAANPDGFYSSYFYKERQDSALYFGPLWDNDISYCNTTRKGDVTQQLMADIGYGDGQAKTWVNQLWKTNWFVSAVSRRFKQLYENGLSTFMLQKVDSLAHLLQQSQEANYKVWSINHRYYEEINLYSTFDEYISELKKFIPAHNDFLYRTFLQTPTFIPDNHYYYCLRNKSAIDMACDVYTAATFEASRLCIYPTTSDRPSQQWMFRPTQNHLMLINRNSQLAAADRFNSEPSMQNILAYRPDSTDERQLWDLIPQGRGGYYTIKNVSTGRVIVNRNGATTTNNPLISSVSDARDATTAERLWSVTLDEPIEQQPDLVLQQQAIDYALRYNPRTHEVHFIASNLDELTFTASIVAVNGSTVATFRAQDSFHAGSLPRGLYLVSWTFAGKQQHAKFLKE